VTANRTLIGKEFQARGPATEKALSLRCSLVLGTQKLPHAID